jgi:hypothetical protein
VGSNAFRRGSNGFRERESEREREVRKMLTFFLEVSCVNDWPVVYRTQLLKKAAWGNMPPYNTKSKSGAGASLLLFNIINRRRDATRKWLFRMRPP